SLWAGGRGRAESVGRVLGADGRFQDVRDPQGDRGLADLPRVPGALQEGGRARMSRRAAAMNAPDPTRDLFDDGREKLKPKRAADIVTPPPAQHHLPMPSHRTFHPI